MKILLATGFTEIEKDVLNNLVKRGDNCWRCYHRQTVMDMVTEYGVKTVVLGPSLDGTKDIYETVITPLWKAGIRIIFMPGAADMSDAREWVEKLFPLGVYCYIFDPVTPESIIERIDNPGNPGELMIGTRSARKIPAEIDESLKQVMLARTTGPEKKRFREWFMNIVKTRKADTTAEEIICANTNSNMIPETVDLQGGFIATSNLNQIDRIIKNPKQPCVVIDVDLLTAKINSTFGVDMEDVWKHDWRLGLLAEPYMINRKTAFYTTADKKVKVTRRDIRAMADIVSTALAKKKDVVVFYSETTTIEKLQEFLDEEVGVNDIC